MRQLKEDVASAKSRPSEPSVKADVFPADRRYEKDFQRLEEELRKQQIQFDQIQVDTIEDAKAIRNYLNEVYEMVLSSVTGRMLHPLRIVRRNQG